MLEKILKLGDKVEIKKIANNNPDATGGKYHVSQLVDICDDNKVNIAMPIEGGKVIPLEIGERYQMCFYTKNGLYQSRGLVVERFRSNQLYVAVVRFTADMEKLQRRQFFRLECILEILFRSLTEEESAIHTKLEKKDYANEDAKVDLLRKLEAFPKDWNTATATDISGGGIRFNSKRLPEESERFEIKLRLNVGGIQREIIARAHPVFFTEIYNHPGTYEYRAEFVGIEMKDREAIVRYVFDEERKRRKREMD